MCLMSLPPAMPAPDCKALSSSLTLGNRALILLWMALNHVWAETSSFARRNKGIRPSAEHTSKYLHEESLLNMRLKPCWWAKGIVIRAPYGLHHSCTAICNVSQRYEGMTWTNPQETTKWKPFCYLYVRKAKLPVPPWRRMEPSTHFMDQLQGISPQSGQLTNLGGGTQTFEGANGSMWGFRWSLLTSCSGFWQNLDFLWAHVAPSPEVVILWLRSPPHVRISKVPTGWGPLL